MIECNNKHHNSSSSLFVLSVEDTKVEPLLLHHFLMHYLFMITLQQASLNMHLQKPLQIVSELMSKGVKNVFVAQSNSCNLSMNFGSSVFVEFVKES